MLRCVTRHRTKVRVENTASVCIYVIDFANSAPFLCMTAILVYKQIGTFMGKTHETSVLFIHQHQKSDHMTFHEWSHAKTISNKTVINSFTTSRVRVKILTCILVQSHRQITVFLRTIVHLFTARQLHHINGEGAHRTPSHQYTCAENLK